MDKVLRADDSQSCQMMSMSGSRFNRGHAAQTLKHSSRDGWIRPFAHGIADGAYSLRHNATAMSPTSCMWSSTGNRIGVGAAGRLTRPGWWPP